MKHRTILNALRFVFPAALVAATVVPAFAGPPLICSRFDIGTATSLPWTVGPDWNGDLETYNRTQLTTDTVALLTDSTPVLVRMETLRRAAIYAMSDKRTADQLLTALVKRAKAAGPDGKISALALFDAGYLAEAYKQANGINGFTGAMAAAIDGRAMVERSLAIRNGDPVIAFAASLMTEGATHANHLKNAQDGAKADQLLAKNLAQNRH